MKKKNRERPFSDDGGVKEDNMISCLIDVPDYREE